MNSLFDTATNFLSEKAGAATRYVKETASEVGGRASSAASTATNFVTEKATDIGKAASGAASTATNFVRKEGTALGNALGEPVDYLKNIDPSSLTNSVEISDRSKGNMNNLRQGLSREYGAPTDSHVGRDALIGAGVGTLLGGPLGALIGGGIGAIAGRGKSEPEDKGERRRVMEEEAAKRAKEAVDVDSPKGREAALDRMVQQEVGKDGKMDPDSENKCSATSILAGAIKAGGREGMSAVLQGTLDKDGKMDDATKALMEKIKDRSQKLTQQDLNDIKDRVYDKMRANENDQKTEYKKDASGNVVYDNDGYAGEPVKASGSDPGVNGATADNYINQNPALKKLFDDNHLRLLHVNNAGQSPDDARANHIVLEQLDGKGNTTSVYDPYMRKDGHQLVTDSDKLQEYEASRRASSNKDLQ